jgi:N6-adenosine-specific RNA methylase IME4
LPDALEVLKAWGWKYSTMITWVKMQAPGVPRIGLGYRARGCTEHLMIATRGNVPAPPTDRRPNSVMFCPRSEHSRKPEFQYDLAECYPGPYCEIFARPQEGLFGPRPGWTQLGNAVDGRCITEALPELAAAPMRLEDPAHV